LDHAAAHDGVGVQDLAWDVAGAIVEHGFSAEDLGFARDAKLAFFIEAHAAKQSAIFIRPPRSRRPRRQRSSRGGRGFTIADENMVST